MKIILCFIITATLLITSASTASTAFAKQHKEGEQQKQKTSQQNYSRYKTKRQEFKIKESPVIKYSKYNLPIKPITKGMGATVTFDKATSVLTVVKGSITIVIDFKKEIVTVNGVEDTKSGIFNAKNSKKTTVLIKYIAKALGIRIGWDKDEVIVEVPGLDLPTNVVVTPFGTTVLANTLNSSTLYMTASANIIAGQATGGKAELYVDSKLVARDEVIAATDTAVTFTTSDGTPINAELQTAVPKSGVVMVRLYNANNQYVTSKVANPKLTVDYVAPSVTGIISATYHAATNKLMLTVTGAGAVGDKVDVTKLSLMDTALGKTYQLTNAVATGSTGVVKNVNLLEITLGSVDKLGLTGFGTSTMYLTVAAGSLLSDAAGNTSTSTTAVQTIPVTVTSTVLDLPTNVTVTPIGTTVIANTLNSSSLFMIASANISAGQAAGGKAELYVGSKLVATDAVIAATDTSVSFTTSDNTPTNTELQAAVPTGGLVTVKLYDANNHSVTSSVSNPTLIVDYVAPSVTGINSAVYNVSGSAIYLNVNGISTIGDKVDVTKISLTDTTSGRTYQLTSSPVVGSTGSVINTNQLVITIGSADKIGLAGFGESTVYLNVLVGSLVSDAAGNSSPAFTTVVSIPVILIK
jgi:hypothetical protein